MPKRRRYWHYDELRYGGPLSPCQESTPAILARDERYVCPERRRHGTLLSEVGRRALESTRAINCLVRTWQGEFDTRGGYVSICGFVCIIQSSEATSYQGRRAFSNPMDNSISTSGAKLRTKPFPHSSIDLQSSQSLRNRSSPRPAPISDGHCPTAICPVRLESPMYSEATHLQLAYSSLWTCGFGGMAMRIEVIAALGAYRHAVAY